MCAGRAAFAFFPMGGLETSCALFGGGFEQIQRDHWRNVSAIGAEGDDCVALVRAPTPFTHFEETAAAHGLCTTFQVREGSTTVFGMSTEGVGTDVTGPSIRSRHGNGHFDHRRGAPAGCGESRRKSRRHFLCVCTFYRGIKRKCSHRRTNRLEFGFWAGEAAHRKLWRP